MRAAEPDHRVALAGRLVDPRAFLFAVATHLFLAVVLDGRGEGVGEGWLLVADAAALVAAVVAEQVTLLVAGRRARRRATAILVAGSPAGGGPVAT